MVKDISQCKTKEEFYRSLGESLCKIPLLMEVMGIKYPRGYIQHYLPEVFPVGVLLKWVLNPLEYKKDVLKMLETIEKMD